MTLPTIASSSSLKDKGNQAEAAISKSNVVQLPSSIELQAAKRLKRSGAKAILGFMNSSYHSINGRH